MSLSRRPTIGLPSTPRARSFTAQARQDIPPRPRSSASERPPPSSYLASPPPLPSYQGRSLRPQRSVGNLPERQPSTVRSRSLGRADSRHISFRSEPPPPLPSLPSSPRPGAAARGRANAPPQPSTHASSRSADYDGPYAYRKRDDRISHSASSSSSAASDEFRSAVSAASSRTSLDDGEMDGDKKPPAGFGSSLWGSIAGVAGNLSINVGKAWASKITTFSGEETPPGAESRLTRVMKAYHIEKARDPSELPDWLFDERERGVRTRPTANSSSSSRARDISQPQSGLSRSPTMRDDADSAARAPVRAARGPTLADRRAAARAEDSSGSAAHVTKSMARLREMRDAKRNAKVRFGDDDDGADSDDGDYRGARPAPVVTPSGFGRERERRAADYAEPLPPTRPRPAASPMASASLGVRGRQPSARLGLPTSVRPVRA